MADPRTDQATSGAAVREPRALRAADRLRGAGRRLNSAARRLRSATTKDVDLPGPRRLAILNLVSRSRLAGGSGPVVSLTTYGTRIRWSHLAIESIARGSLTPSRTVLWLDDEAAFSRLPRPLRRLRRRGLEIRLSENFGPHTKYFPFIEASDSFTGPLVTADDDTIYPRFWLERLVQEHRRTPDAVVCYRARRITASADALDPYEQWDFSRSAEPSWLHFATAVSGVIHPVAMLDELKRRGRAFQSVCPDADDVWMHHTALAAGIPIRLIDGESRTFPLLEGTQEVALWYVNVSEGRNDAQIAATYSAEDISRLVEAAHRASSTD